LPPEFIEAAKVYRILKSAADAGLHGVHPFTVIEHALGKELPLPVPLLEAVRERFRLERKRAELAIEDTLSEADEAAPHPRSKQFLLRLIYVLATQGYGLKLDMPYNDARDIAEDAERLGLALDQGTIANYLREARQQAEVLGLVA
jgi:hypothetical protein